MHNNFVVFYGSFTRDNMQTILNGIYIGGLGLSEAQADMVAIACVDAHPREIIIPRVIQLNATESFRPILKRFEDEIEQMDS